jgi:hypothetical protein
VTSAGLTAASLERLSMVGFGELYRTDLILFAGLLRSWLHFFSGPFVTQGKPALRVAGNCAYLGRYSG